jgi:hypothetical protein
MPQKGREHFNLTGFKCTNGYILMEKVSLCPVTGVKNLGDSKFVKGTNNFKKDTLDYHNGNKGNAKRGVFPRLKIRPCDLKNQ